MALIKCSECGKEFSDKAQACPNCACPVEVEIKKVDKVTKAIKENEIMSTVLNLKKLRLSRNIILGILSITCI